MRKMLLAIPILSFPLPLFASARVPVAQEKIPVLLLSGANNHEWEWTTPSLEAILAESGRFDVTVTKEPAVTLADADALAAYRVVLLDYNGPRWGEPAQPARSAAGRPDVDRVQFADPLVERQFTGEAEVAIGPLLGPELKDRAVAVTGLAQRLILGQAQPHWFFEVDVLARPRGLQRHQDVPVVGRRRQDHVDIVAGDDLGKVRVDSTVAVAIVLVDQGRNSIPTGLLQIADAHDTAVFLAQEVPHHAGALRPRPDAADRDALAGRDITGLAQRRRTHKVGKTQRSEGQTCCLFDEAST